MGSCQFFVADTNRLDSPKAVIIFGKFPDVEVFIAVLLNNLLPNIVKRLARDYSRALDRQGAIAA